MFITLITPLIILFSYVLFNDEIFNKFSFLITSTGYLAIVYLTIVLIIPLFNFKNDSFSTKNIGVSAFYLSFLHLLLYIYDNNFEPSFLFEDLVYRNYITSGYIAFILFLPMYLTSFSFFGPTCDSLDYMKGPFLLPNNIKEGDYIELGQLGAYGLTFRTNFNGFYSNEIFEVNDKPIMSIYEGSNDKVDSLVA